MGRRLHGSAVANNNVYVFGGSPGSDKEQKLRTNCVECYDSIAKQWIRKKDMPFSTHCVATNVINDIFVLPYGDSVMLKYDALKDEYVEMGSLPLPNWHGFAVTSNNETIYVVGGATCAKWSKKAFSYNVNDCVWNELPELSLARRRTAIAIGMSV